MHDDARTSANDALAASDHLWHPEPHAADDEPATQRDQIVVELTAAVIAIRQEQPVVLAKARTAIMGDGVTDELPSARFRPALHASLDEAMRTVIEAEAGFDAGFLEQLSSDCPRFLFSASGTSAARRLSIGHLALARADGVAANPGCGWASIYEFLPWEDWRSGRPAMIEQDLMPHLSAWVAEDPAHTDQHHPLCRRERLAVAFGADGGRWDDERVPERLDLLSECGLGSAGTGRSMSHDHRRVLAMALGRLRSKVRNRPVVFELLPPEFTLFELQKSVEAILGPHLHKQNFRRLVEGTGLVEPTGDVRTHTGGRPAKLFRFRREVLLERPAPGVRIRPARAG